MYLVKLSNEDLLLFMFDDVNNIDEQFEAFQEIGEMFIANNEIISKTRFTGAELDIKNEHRFIELTSADNLKVYEYDVVGHEECTTINDYLEVDFEIICEI